MRNKLYVLLVAAIFFSAIWQYSVTSASNQRAAEQQQVDPATQQTQLVGMPNYDIRQDIRAAAPNRLNQMGVEVAAADPQAMQNAIEAFRQRIPAEARDNLRVEMNDTGLPKMVFNTEGPLSAPQSEQPDAIARGFLADHSAMLGLDRNQISEMKLRSEDNDKNT